jgi:hypothetical protein
MTRASQVVRQLGSPDPLAGFESSTVLEYRLSDDVEPVRQKWGDRSKVSSISDCKARYYGNASERKAHSEKNGRFPSRERTICELFRS